jgi:hypothetical protein
LVVSLLWLASFSLSELLVVTTCTGNVVQLLIVSLAILCRHFSLQYR